MSQNIILIAVGSSGGHIYPALAIADRLKTTYITSKNQICAIHFVHSGSKVGKEIFSSLKYPSHIITIGGLAKGQSIFIKIKTMLCIPLVCLKTLFLIYKLNPQFILGTGGAITGPVLMMGFLLGKNTAIWEGNASLGLANRYLSYMVNTVFTVFPKVKGLNQKKQILCAYPLRKNLHNQYIINKKADDIKKQKKKFTVLILGGSQGSKFLNQVVCQAVLEEQNWRKDIFIYHQTGKKYFHTINKSYRTVKNAIEAFSFSHNIAKYYAISDLIFSRAGSGAIWEIASFTKPLVLIPIEQIAGGHQLKNAMYLVKSGKAEMIQEKHFNPESFKNMLVSLKQNKQKRKNLALSLKTALKQEDGANQIASWILKQIEK